ncbi:MAG TPA: hypothetical protein VL863_06700 [bacterium]|nr:hypothetical protein [bacterium]
MKYQFQFAGVNSERRAAPQRKRLRLALLVVAFILAVLAYANYLYNLSHGHSFLFATIGQTVPVASPAPAAARPKLAAPTTQQLPPALKKATEAGVTAVGTLVADSLKALPAAPVQTAPVATAAPTATDTLIKPQTAMADPTGFKIVPEQQVTRKPTRARTPQERLLRAGQVAFGNVMELVSKYPDAYGFGPEDTFTATKLGDPIQIYTIVEEDRAKYQTGQALKPLLKPTDSWVFPVIVGERICCMVQVNYTGRDYVPDKGSKLLGLAWNKITQKWPASQGYHPCLVVTSDIPGYYFTVPELPNQNLTDIVQMFYYRPTLSPADVILASWR